MTARETRASIIPRNFPLVLGMERQPFRAWFYETLGTGVCIDESLGCILKLKLELGLFRNPYQDACGRAKVRLPEFRTLNRPAAEETITPPKNKNGLLTLSKDNRILLTGAGA